MIQTFELYPGITLRCFRSDRFKQGTLSVLFLQKLERETASVNALIPVILLQGTEKSPDLQAITRRLDDLYGAAVGVQVRALGDYQVTGLCCSFIEDAYALPGDRILAPMTEFLGELLFSPVLESGCFRKDFVDREKRNLILAIEARRNDKREYAAGRLLEEMCSSDSMGISRLGTKEAAEKITPQSAFDRYKKVLKESPVEIFYVGSAEGTQVAELLKPLFALPDRNYVNLPAQTAFADPPRGSHMEKMDVAQGRLGMAFTTDITLRDDRFAAMQVANMIFGGGMTGKLFMEIREAHSLCYDIGSAYYGSKGVVTVSAGIDFDKEAQVTQQVLALLEQTANGEFTDEELTAAKQGLICQLQATHDSPGMIDSYYTSGKLVGLNKTPAEHIRAVEEVTAESAARAAKTLHLHTRYFLRGEG